MDGGVDGWMDGWMDKKVIYVELINQNNVNK